LNLEQLPSWASTLLVAGAKPDESTAVEQAGRRIAVSVQDAGGSFADFVEIMTRPGHGLARQYAKDPRTGRPLVLHGIRVRLFMSWKLCHCADNAPVPPASS
jgi:hypothetical protein